LHHPNEPAAAAPEETLDALFFAVSPADIPLFRRC
jgi:hypothetical protein